MKNGKINVLRMIRIAKDLNMEEMAEYFLVSKAYISAIEKGIRNISLRTLKFGLNNLGILIEDYFELVDFAEKLDEMSLNNESKYKFMLIKTLGVVSPELKDKSNQILGEFLNSGQNKIIK